MSLSIFCLAQPGAHIYIGISNAINKSADITPENQSHPGFHLGVDGRLNEGNMYFLLGAQYHQNSHLPKDEFSARGHEFLLHWVKIRVGLGYNLLNIGPQIKIRAKTLFCFDLLYPQLEVAKFGQYEYNGGTASGVVGLGLDVFFFTIDAEYHHSFLNAIKDVKGTGFDFWALNFGFFF